MHKPDILISAPSVFAKEPVSAASRHYKFIPTTQLIDDFKLLGWDVHRATQQKSHTDPTHTKHRVTFRSDAFPPENGLYPELIMVNSHDRTTAFSFMLGLYNEATSSGLVVRDKVFESLRLRHMGYNFEDLRELTKTIMDNMPNVMAAVYKMQTTNITSRECVDFAVNGVATRFPEYSDHGKLNVGAITKAIDILSLVVPDANEESTPTVWGVYSRIQEHVIKGGFKRIGTKDERVKSVRPITNIKLDIDVNRKLWEMASDYVSARRLQSNT